jgi:hypothetical protein
MTTAWYAHENACVCISQDRPLRLSVVLFKKNAQDNVVAECETTLRVILNTQRDYDEDSWEADMTRHGFILKRSLASRKQKEVGRLRVTLAQLIDTAKEDATETFDVHKSLNDIGAPPSSSGKDASADPYAIDMAKIPTPMAAPATFEDYVRDGILLDFCVAIDFTSSNGKKKETRTELLTSCSSIHNARAQPRQATPEYLVRFTTNRPRT